MSVRRQISPARLGQGFTERLLLTVQLHALHTNERQDQLAHAQGGMGYRNHSLPVHLSIISAGGIQSGDDRL